MDVPRSRRPVGRQGEKTRSPLTPTRERFYQEKWLLKIFLIEAFFSLYNQERRS